jgi:drug/metabolite transporter (DMT)-like permease
VSKIIITLYVFITSFALVAIKYGSDKGQSQITDKLPINLNIYTISGIALYAISFLLYIYLLSKYDLGYIIPLLTAFLYVVIFIVSFFLLKEAFTVAKVFAIILILTGVIILNIGSKSVN